MDKPVKKLTTTLFIAVTASFLHISPASSAENTSLLDTTLPATVVPDYGFGQAAEEDQQEGPILENATYDRWFPIFGQWAVDHGADLPSPFGVAFNYMYIRQGIHVQSLEFGGLSGTSLLNSSLVDEALSDTSFVTGILKSSFVQDGLQSLVNRGFLDRSVLTGLNFALNYAPNTVPPLLKSYLQNPQLQAFLSSYLDSLNLNEFFQIDVGKTRQKTHTDSARIDAWIFPFWDLYVLLGRTRGHSNSIVNVGSSNSVVSSLLQSYVGHNIQYELELKGNTYGIGSTLAFGYANVFGSLDFNYSRTHLSVVHGAIDAFVFTPRIGYQIHIPGWERIHYPKSTLSLWVGAMYQRVQQDYNGNLSNLKFSGNLQNIVNALDPGSATFHVKQNLENRWNMLLGARYDIGKHLAVTTEWGFIHRNSFFISVEGRF